MDISERNRQFRRLEMDKNTKPTFTLFTDGVARLFNLSYFSAAAKGREWKRLKMCGSYKIVAS